MTPPIIVPKGERGFIRVFALSMDDDEAQSLKDDADQLNAAFGIEGLDPDYVEVFPVADLEEMGLATYLVEGQGAMANEVAVDAEKLAALDGWVIVMHSQALGGRGATLSPDYRITLIRSYTEDGVDWSGQPIETESAQLYSVKPVTSAPVAKAPRGLILGILAVAAGLFLLFFLRQG